MRSNNSKCQLFDANEIVKEEKNLSDTEKTVFEYLKKQPQIKKTLYMPLTIEDIALELRTFTKNQVEEALERLKSLKVISIVESADPFRLFVIKML